jgi:thiamine-monophosphate kinase
VPHHERDIIHRVVDRLCPAASPPGRRLKLGPGDDAAVLSSGNSDWVLTCDQFLEGTHFLADVHPADSVGFKALARATSDLAAMGAAPEFFLLSVALPPARTGAWLDRMLAGMARAARRFALVLAGGDVSSNPSVVMNLTVLGSAAPGRWISRNAAGPGDLLFLSGCPGAAQLGLKLLLRARAPKPGLCRLLRPHLYPEPRIALGQWLARERIPSAMIDTSDGLSTDVANLCEASRVGAILFREQIPLPPVPASLRRKLDPVQLALHGGEDYELLFAVPRRRAAAVPAAFRGVPLTCIGEITRRRGVLLLDSHGRRTHLRAGGWDPFRARAK